MNLESRMEYLEAVVRRYLQAAKALKTRILDELCKVCGYNRKYAIWKLNRWPERKEATGRRVRCRDRRYEGEVFRVMEKVWKAAGYPWSVRLKEILRLWLPWIRRRYRLIPGREEKLLRMSPSTIDRYLQSRKDKIKRRLYGRTKPGALLRHQIPVKCVLTSGGPGPPHQRHHQEAAFGILFTAAYRLRQVRCWWPKGVLRRRTLRITPGAPPSFIFLKLGHYRA